MIAESLSEPLDSLPVASRDTGFRKLKRRLNQFYQMAFSPVFKDPSTAQKAIQERYQSLIEVEFYTLFAHCELYPGEDRACKDLANSLTGRQALVVGSGAGREAFELEDRGFTVTAIDCEPAMVRQAQKLGGQRQSPTKFIMSSLQAFPKDQPFDLVFVTAGITGHIQGQDQRAQFLAQCAEHLAPNGRILFTPEILKLKPLGHYWWSSLALKIRWWSLKSWEKGDVARSFLGRHNSSSKLFFFHFYQSIDEVLAEVRQAYLVLDRQYEDVFVLKQRSASHGSPYESC